MKKSLLTAFALMAFASTINAQDEAAAAFKPKAGDLAVELGLAGGLNNLNTKLNEGGLDASSKLIKARYFLSDKMAVRVSFDFSANSVKNKFYDSKLVNGVSVQTDTYGTEKIKSSSYGINLGIEKHFKGTERLSTYLGGDLQLLIKGASQVLENTNGTNYVDGYKESMKGTNSEGDKGGLGFGLRAVTGADYYFVKKVYLGAEIGWGFSTMKDAKVKTETTPGTGQPTTTVEKGSTGGNWTVAPQLVAGVRIGYIF